MTQNDHTRIRARLRYQSPAARRMIETLLDETEAQQDERQYFITCKRQDEDRIDRLLKALDQTENARIKAAEKINAIRAELMFISQTRVSTPPWTGLVARLYAILQEPQDIHIRAEDLYIKDQGGPDAATDIAKLNAVRHTLKRFYHLRTHNFEMQTFIEQLEGLVGLPDVPSGSSRDMPLKETPKPALLWDAIHAAGQTLHALDHTEDGTTWGALNGHHRAYWENKAEAVIRAYLQKEEAHRAGSPAEQEVSRGEEKTTVSNDGETTVHDYHWAALEEMRFAAEVRDPDLTLENRQGRRSATTGDRIDALAKREYHLRRATVYSNLAIAQGAHDGV